MVQGLDRLFLAGPPYVKNTIKLDLTSNLSSQVGSKNVPVYRDVSSISLTAPSACTKQFPNVGFLLKM